MWKTELSKNVAVMGNWVYVTRWHDGMVQHGSTRVGHQFLGQWVAGF